MVNKVQLLKSRRERGREARETGERRERKGDVMEEREEEGERREREKRGEKREGEGEETRRGSEREATMSEIYAELLTWIISSTILVDDDLRACDRVCSGDHDCLYNGHVLRFLLRAFKQKK